MTGQGKTKVIDGTPEKRLFLSIISDYDLKTGLCELIDNAVDQWVADDKKHCLTVDIHLDVSRQIISVSDNSGGVEKDQLRLLVAPGASGPKGAQDAIGIFGVGGKRAGVALGERVEITTRRGTGDSYKIEITSEWLKSDDWRIPANRVSDILPNSTTIEISHLRQSFDWTDVDHLGMHFAETYSSFIGGGCRIKLNGNVLSAVCRENWSYPPDFMPRKACFEIELSQNRKVEVELTAGLISDRNPEEENYGVDFYCNNRLILKDFRSRDVGYVRGEAGVPHPDASLCRAVVKLLGPPELMPWNSSKSGINFSHPVFLAVRPKLIELVSYFSSLSRRLKNNWESRVFSFKSGAPEPIGESEILSNHRLILPELPRVRKLARIHAIKEKNKSVVRNKPWTLGLVEAIGIVELVFDQGFETKNRAALILLDSNFEIALKEFIVNRADLFRPDIYNDSKIADIFKSRHKVIKEVTAHVSLSISTLDKVRHYYGLRNKLVHERATVGITDNQVIDYQKTVESVLKKLFGLKFPPL